MHLVSTERGFICIFNRSPTKVNTNSAGRPAQFASISAGLLAIEILPIFWHYRSMGRPGNKIRIPPLNDDLVAAILKVKPTADMPRQGANGKKRGKKNPKRSK